MPIVYLFFSSEALCVIFAIILCFIGAFSDAASSIAANAARVVEIVFYVLQYASIVLAVAIAWSMDFKEKKNLAATASHLIISSMLNLIVMIGLLFFNYVILHAELMGLSQASSIFEEILSVVSVILSLGACLLVTIIIFSIWGKAISVQEDSYALYILLMILSAAAVIAVWVFIIGLSKSECQEYVDKLPVILKQFIEFFIHKPGMFIFNLIRN